MTGAYYNEHDKGAAEWLRTLILFGHIAPGDVDERSIEDISPDDLRGYTQHHFFAGIGVWSAALRAAGWDDDRPVWTGSCPCQPFSTAGQGAGFADERHLWPAWHWLIEQHRPGVVLGEQVASRAGLAWFDLVSTDLEGAGYAVGAHDLCAAGVGAPHIRQRLFFVAHDDGERFSARTHEPARGPTAQKPQRCSSRSPLVDATGEQAGLSRCTRVAGSAVAHHHTRLEVVGEQPARPERKALERSGAAGGVWADVDWIPCRDGKWRPVEPGTFPLARGAPGRVGRLRGYGNAIVLPVAQAFIEAAMTCL